MNNKITGYHQVSVSAAAFPMAHWNRNTSFRNKTIPMFTKKVWMSQKSCPPSYHARGKGLPATVGHVCPRSQSEPTLEFWKMGVPDRFQEALRHRWRSNNLARTLVLFMRLKSHNYIIIETMRPLFRRQYERGMKTWNDRSQITTFRSVCTRKTHGSLL